MDWLDAFHRKEHGSERQCNSQQTLHISASAAVQLAVPLHHREGVGVPLLAVHRHHVGVAGQHDAALRRTTLTGQRGEEVRLCFLWVVHQRGGDADGAEVVADVVDEGEVGVAANGVEADEPGEPLPVVAGIACSRGHCCKTQSEKLRPAFLLKCGRTRTLNRESRESTREKSLPKTEESAGKEKYKRTMSQHRRLQKVGGKKRRLSKAACKSLTRQYFSPTVVS